MQRWMRLVACVMLRKKSMQRGCGSAELSARLACWVCPASTGAETQPCFARLAQSPYKKYTTRRRPPVESALPSITGSGVFSASARYGSDAQQTYRSTCYPELPASFMIATVPCCSLR